MNLAGYTGVVQEVWGSLFRGAKVHVVPQDHGAFGQYSAGFTTGIIPAALAANSEIFQFRWADATRLCNIRRVRISAAVSTTFFAAGVPIELQMKKATGWTGAGTGGTAFTPAAECKKRTSMASSLVVAGDVRVATTAALGAGTKTLEGNAIAELVAAGPVTLSLSGIIIPSGTAMFEANVGDGVHPLILAQNEGFVIRCVAVPATGTWQATVDVEWAESDNY